jgi:glycosyltransferase involved in cell wall biosynthesis
MVSSGFVSSQLRYRNACQDLAERLEDAGFTILTTSSARHAAPRALDMIVTTWRRRRNYDIGQIDIFSGRAFLWAEAASLLMSLARKPQVMTLHGGDLPSFARRFPRRVRRLLNRAQIVTAPSAYLQERLSAFHPGIRVIPNAINRSRYPYRLRDRLRPCLVWLRAFHHIYNPGMAVQVTALLREQFPDVHLTMIGPDKGDGSLHHTQQLIRRLSLEERVTVIKGVPRTEVPGWLDQVDIFLNTAFVDSTPVSVAEAKACGLCIVSTNVGGLPYLLQDGCDALLVPPGDPAAMAAAVARLLREPAFAGRLSSQARAEAEHLDWSAVLPRWETLLLDLHASGRPPKKKQDGQPGE